MLVDLWVAVYFDVWLVITGAAIPIIHKSWDTVPGKLMSEATGMLVRGGMSERGTTCVQREII